MQSRYYDPELGRFLNADSYASTGQGILGNNMFAYCGNNSANYADPSGNQFGPTGSHIKATYFLDPGLRGTALAQLQRQGPDWDGTFVFYGNTEECCGNVLTAQVGVGNVSSPGVTDEGITLGEMKVSLIRCALKGLHHEVELGNMLNASISADISWSGSGSLNLMVSAWSPSVTVVTDRGTFIYTLHIGAIGVGAEWDVSGYASINVACGIGFGFSYQR